MTSNEISWDVVQIGLLPVFFYTHKALLMYLAASLNHFTFKTKTFMLTTALLDTF